MDHGACEGISDVDIQEEEKIMKKKIIVLLALVLTIGLYPISAKASETDASGIIDQIKQQLADVFENVDKETAGEIFSFLKEQVAEGNISADGDLGEVIKEGEEKFGVEIDEADAQRLVETMEKLENMGFSAEYVIDKAETLYDEYGAEFADHADELVKGAVKNAAENVAGSVWQNVKNSVKNFFKGLFK